jgi:hypothetical protein
MKKTISALVLIGCAALLGAAQVAAAEAVPVAIRIAPAGPGETTIIGLFDVPGPARVCAKFVGVSRARLITVTNGRVTDGPTDGCWRFDPADGTVVIYAPTGPGQTVHFKLQPAEFKDPKTAQN